MKRNGNILFTRRVVSIVCMLLVAVSVLMPVQVVRASAITKNANMTVSCYLRGYDLKNKTMATLYDNGVMSGSSPIYSFIIYPSKPYRSTPPDSSSEVDTYDFIMGYCSASSFSVKGNNYWALPDGSEPQSNPFSYDTTVNDAHIYDSTYCSLFGNYSTLTCYSINPTKIKADIVIGCDSFRANSDKNSMCEALGKLQNYVLNGVVSDKMMLNVDDGASYKAREYDSSLGFLAGVELQQIHDKSKEKKGSPDGSGLMETIIYNDKTTTGVDLKNGDYKIEVAWANAYLNAKSTAYYAEDKKKTSICTFDAKLNCKSADSLKRYYYSVLDANKKCKDNSTDGFEPSMFTIITKHLKSQPTYWYRIVTKDNKYSGWVKIGIKGGGVDDITFPQDTYDNDDNKVDADHGGYHKDNSKEAIGSGDSKDEAIEDSVADSQRKDDNNVINNGSSKDLWDSLKEFVKGVESVPVMIADLFSFLPSWCLGLVASGFALMISLMIINCIKS